MKKQVRDRTALDAGASTGVATTVLALLSASALASFGLVTANQLTPNSAERSRAGGAGSSLQPPANVVITPRTDTGAGATGGGPGSGTGNGPGSIPGLPALPLPLPGLDRKSVV